MVSPHPAVDRTMLRSAVDAAIQAPSVHNTQPWLFRLGPDRVELHADRSRALGVLDPTGRQLRISCGAALGFLRVALRAQGLDATLDLEPVADERSDHLATVLVREGSPADEAELRLAAAIGTRHMQRTPFAARTVPEQVIRSLRKAAESEDAFLDVLGRRDQQLALTVLLSRADRMEMQDEAYRAELRAWVRTDTSTDGVPEAALPPRGERHTEVTLRDYTPDGPALRTDDDGAGQPVDEHPLVLVLGTDADTPADHLRAGLALSRILLLGTVAGLGASPLGQVLDWPGPRAQLRQQLQLQGEPQMVLRVGYPGAAGAGQVTSARRPVEDVIVDGS